MTERRSIEIDYCPDCRGVWLDRGELDKLIAQDAGRPEVAAAARPRTDEHRDRDPSYDRDRAYDHHRTDYRGHKKKRSLFDVFDFD
jgi:Zn-finger nucleic acid-binding protein